MRMRVEIAGLAVLVAALGVALAPPAAAGAVVRSTHLVPVSTPDELGLPVALDTDVYLPTGAAPHGGWPLVVVFHGGGSDKANAFDAGHAQTLAEHGYAALIYSARGHGESGGHVTVAGPKEVRDAFDVLGWALREFPLARDRIALTGYSQGGLHTNLVQAWSDERALNPDGIRFRALLPGNTPDVTFNALVDHAAVKLSFGAGLIATYQVGGRGRVAPIVDKWIATAAADQPALYGAGDVCDATGHDRPGSAMKADLAARSVGCRAERMTLPTFWAQAFDDELFPADMAIDMWRRMPEPRNRLYLSMGGHGAPAADDAVERAKLDGQIAFLDHVLRGRALDAPRVVYWSRDPRVVLPAGARAWPRRAWVRREASTWPPVGTRATTYTLSADGRATTGRAAAGDMPLAPVGEDLRHDPVYASTLAGTPIGTSPVSAPPPTTVRGTLAAFSTARFRRARELSGTPSVKVAWTPAGPDSQLVLKVLDEAPGGTLTLLGRGVQGLRGAGAGERRDVTIETKPTSVLIRRGHRLLFWISAGDSSFYKPYPGQSPGVLRAGPSSTATLPLRATTRRGGPA